VRDRRQPERYSPPDFHSNFALSITDDDPRTVKEAVNSEDSKLSKKAMVEEMDALDKNEAWDIVELPSGRKLVARKWLFKKKLLFLISFPPQSNIIRKGWDITNCTFPLIGSP
jgi:hypothetical protein